MVAITALVAYDYLLNLALEVELIWARPLSWTTYAYLMMRYLGLAYIGAQPLIDLNISLTNGG